MPANNHASLISSIYDAPLAPDSWAAALEAVARSLSAVGAAYILSNKQTGRVEWTCLSGPSVEFKAEFVNYYGALDPYSPLLGIAPRGRWMGLSECMPKEVLRTDEWYNEFVLKCGVGDILGARLLETASHTVIFGVHQETGKGGFSSAAVVGLQALFEPLSRAARLHTEFRRLGWQAHITRSALDQIAAGVILTDDEGRVIEMNHAAERVLGRNDGLMVRNGKLGTARAFENTKLGCFIAAATAKEKSEAAMRRMFAGRRGNGPAYVLTITPLPDGSAFFDRPLAMIVLAEPGVLASADRDVGELFGLSPAESRLAQALMAGKKLRDVAVEAGVQTSTLRTQLSSILRKVGAERQSDLLRILFSVPAVAARSPKR